MWIKVCIKKFEICLTLQCVLYQRSNLLMERWIQSSAGLHGSHRKFAIVFLSSSAESRECLICDTANGEQCVEYADKSFSKQKM